MVVSGSNILVPESEGSWRPLSWLEWLATGQVVPAFISLAVDSGQRLALANVKEPFTPPQGMSWADSRAAFFTASKKRSSILARALQLANWGLEFRYCGRCGQMARAAIAEHAMLCKCGGQSFPRISPCVLALVWRQDEVLLARPAHFPPGMYSAVAGFIEAGEAAELAVAREVREETGVEIGDPSYFGSESWPFPSQLMLAYSAPWREGEIAVKNMEIEDARWFSKNAMPKVPPAARSLSGKLIAAWLNP